MINEENNQTHNCLTQVTGCHNFTARGKLNKNWTKRHNVYFFSHGM